VTTPDVRRESPASGVSRLATSAYAYLQLVRLPQVFVVIAGSLIGAKLAGLNMLPVTTIALVIGSNSLLFCASIAFNDWHDVVEDAVNQPARPIPSGRVARGRALGAAIVMFACALVLALGVSWKMAVLAVAVCLLSVGYTVRWKPVPLFGNAVVAALSAYPLWCWLALDAQSGEGFGVLILGCFVFRLGAELVKTGEDHVGDRRAGISTVATRKGADYANRLGVMLMCAALLLLLLFLAPQRSLVVSIGLVGSSMLAVGACVWVVRNNVARHDASRRLVGVGRTIMVVMVTALLLDGR